MRADGARPGHFVVVMCRDRLVMSTVVSTIFISDSNSTTTCSLESLVGSLAGSLGSLGSDGIIIAITTATATVTTTTTTTTRAV